MCFGGGDLPKVESSYVKPDYGPLPSLGTGDPVVRKGPTYQAVRKGSKVRSLLMPMEMSNG